MNPSTALARVLVDELVRQGVREVVLAPGSRSAPLAFALRDAEQAGRVRLHVRIDERTAAFLALGLATACEPARPVAVVTTSGTAVANLHPAVLEAHHSGAPLVVITADRPAELRGVGANQTTDQVAIFGSAVREMVDLAAPRREVGQVRYWRDVALRVVVAARGTRSNDPGPVHLNVGLPEPLVPDGDQGWVEPLEDAGPTRRVDSTGTPSPTELADGPRTVVLAGDGASSAARWLAESAGWPLLAEPSSGARSGPNAVGPYRLLLETSGLGARIERVVAYGRPTLSRPVTRLLARDDVELVVVSERPRWPDPGRRARAVISHPVAPGGTTTDEWLTRWLLAGSRADAAVSAVLADAGLCGPSVARDVAARVRPGGLLIAGSSNPVRDLDLTMRPYDHSVNDPSDDQDGLSSRPIRVLANRGLSGIDGMVSTAVGAALGWQAEHPATAYALIGDLTFLHDSNGLVIGPDEHLPDLVLVVLDDDGGGIFHTLEPGETAHAASFERLFGTPHGVDLAAICAATGTPYQQADTPAALSEALDRAERGPPGIRVVAAPVDRSGRRDLEARLTTAVQTAVAGPA